MRPTITIATSLAPAKDIKIQREAVESWQRLDFRVLSVNCAEEAAVLKRSFPGMEFVEVFRDARKQFRKPYVFFDDMMSCLGKQSSELCGIVNSDIYFPDKELYPFLIAEGTGSFIYGSRMDVEALDERKGKMIQDGFDFFFFDRRISATYPSSRFCIGIPCWDYWAVLSPLFLGINVKKVITPHAYHIKHDVSWDNRISQLVFRRELLRHIKPLSVNAASVHYILAFMDRYSLKLHTGDAKYDRELLPYQVPRIRKVITKEEIRGEVIDELVFLRRK